MNRIPGTPPGWGGYKRMEYNDSYPPASVIHLSFPERGEMPPVKLHWYDGGILPERPDDLEPERNLPESGTIFVGDKGKMWCETYSESPRLIPEAAMTAFTPFWIRVCATLAANAPGSFVCTRRPLSNTPRWQQLMKTSSGT